MISRQTLLNAQTPFEKWHGFITQHMSEPNVGFFHNLVTKIVERPEQTYLKHMSDYKNYVSRFKDIEINGTNMLTTLAKHSTRFNHNMVSNTDVHMLAQAVIVNRILHKHFRGIEKLRITQPTCPVCGNVVKTKHTHCRAIAKNAIQLTKQWFTSDEYKQVKDL